MKKQLAAKFILVVAIVALVITGIVMANGLYQNRELFDAIENDDYEAAKTAIESGAWVNTRKELLHMPNLVPTNPTPLIAACEKGNEEIVELLLNNGANINKKDSFTEQTPLLAALHGEKKNRFSLAMYLIENDADIFTFQKTTSPLEETLVVLDSDDTQTIQEGFELFQYLLQHQVSMDICRGEENVLTFATHYNNYNAVKYLIEEEYFDVNSRDYVGDTALIVAIKNNQTEIVELLIELGADISLTDSEGKTAIDYAMALDNEDVISILKY